MPNGNEKMDSQKSKLNAQVPSRIKSIINGTSPQPSRTAWTNFQLVIKNKMVWNPTGAALDSPVMSRESHHFPNAK